jgi:hypothetical protein
LLHILKKNFFLFSTVISDRLLYRKKRKEKKRKGKEKTLACATFAVQTLNDKNFKRPATFVKH